jgi:hypothetical protein
MKESNDEQKAWKSKYTNNLKLTTKVEYVLFTDGSYDDVDNLLGKNDKDLPYWLGAFYSCNSAKGYRAYRAPELSDREHTINKRIAMGDDRFGKGEAKVKVFCNVIHFDIFHKELMKDRNTGKVLLSKYGDNAGEEMKRFEVVESIKARKRLVANPDEDTSFFRKKYIEFTSKQHSDVTEKLLSMSNQCHCGGSLQPLAYACPSCDEVMVSDEDLKISELNTYGESERRCQHCRTSVNPIPIVECSKCEDPRPYMFNEVVVGIKKTGTGLQTKVEIESITKITDFRLDNGDPIIELDESGEGITEDDKFMLIEDVEYLAAHPFDFNEGKPVATSGQVSDDLALKQGDVGYAAGFTPYGKKESSGPRRMWR